jgi:integrase
MPLTTKQIEAAKFGVSPERLADGLGLYVRLYGSGAKAFEARVTVDGKRPWIQLGHFPEIGLRRARQLASTVQERVDGGLTVAEVRAALKAGPEVLEKIEEPHSEPQAPGAVTFREIAKEWFVQKRRGLRNGKHIQQNWSSLETCILPHFGDRPIIEIRVADVIDVIRPIWHAKHETARRTLSRVKEIFALAMIRGLRPANPADFSARVALGRVRRSKGHFGALPFEEIPDLWDWVQTAKCEETTRQLAMLMILTAKRSKESRYARWDFIDEEGGIWTTPKELMKMSRAHRVPISRQVGVVFGNMRLLTGDAASIFDKPNTKSGVISENTICNLLQRYRPGITAHGLRAGFRSWARRAGKYAPDEMEFALAHEQDDLEAAYQREDLIEERAALMQDWADFVTKGRNPTTLISR